jgi:hypothetical protein
LALEESNTGVAGGGRFGGRNCSEVDAAVLARGGGAFHTGDSPRCERAHAFASACRFETRVIPTSFSLWRRANRDSPDHLETSSSASTLARCGNAVPSSSSAHETDMYMLSAQLTPPPENGQCHCEQGRCASYMTCHVHVHVHVMYTMYTHNIHTISCVDPGLQTAAPQKRPFGGERRSSRLRAPTPGGEHAPITTRRAATGVPNVRHVVATFRREAPSVRGLSCLSLAVCLPFGLREHVFSTRADTRRRAPPNTRVPTLPTTSDHVR